MTTISNQLSEIVGLSCAALGLESNIGTVVKSDRPDLSDFQSNVAFVAAKILKDSPRNIAQQIVNSIDNPLIGSISVAGPGFINIAISDTALAEYITNIAFDRRYGVEKISSDTVIIDFGGYNIAKELHIGHLRTTLLGDTLQRLMRFAGDTVISDVHLGDWGLQIGMMIEAVKKDQPNCPLFKNDHRWGNPLSIDDLNRLYPEASTQCKSDDAEMKKAQQALVDLQNGDVAGYRRLWGYMIDVSVSEIKLTLSPYQVCFDHWNGESNVHHIIPNMCHDLETTGVLKRDSGALTINVGDHIPPVIVEKSDGGYTYAATELATMIDRQEKYSPDRIIHVTDVRQSLHFEQVFSAARIAKIVPETTILEHVSFGTINGSDGKPFKTRSGDTVKLKDVTQMALDSAYERVKSNAKIKRRDIDDVARKVAMSIIKFADQSIDRNSDYIFDMDAFSASTGKTGPYILYSAVRIKSILDQCSDILPGPVVLSCKEDRNLAMKMTGLPDAIKASYVSLSPHHLCQYIFELAQAFNAFYKQCHISTQSDVTIQCGWVTLIQVCLDQFRCILEILGIEIPDRM